MADVVGADEVVTDHSRVNVRGVHVVLALIFAYVLVFGILTWRQQSNFGTFGFDMGIYDQGIWLVSRFREPMLTVRGLNYFGHHVNLITLLFVPFYWLGAGPHFLYLVETIAMAARRDPDLSARQRQARRRVRGSLVPAAAYLLFPSLEWINWWHFHPDALIITPLLFAGGCASRRGSGGGSASRFVCALLAKEDAALAVFMMGGVLFFRGERKWACRTMAAGIVWFLICTRLDDSDRQRRQGAVLRGVLSRLRTFDVRDRVEHRSPPQQGVRRRVPARPAHLLPPVARPVGLLPFAAPIVLLIGGPQTLVNIVSAHSPTHDIRFHYSSIVIAAIFLATAEGFVKIAKRGEGFKIAVVALLVMSSVMANHEWSPSPIGRQYRSGIWAQPQLKHAAINRAIAMLKPGDGVTATYYIVPHITHRQYAYEFPNPFRVANWGVNGEDPPKKSTSDVLLLDVSLNGTDQPLYESLVGDSGPFKIVFDRDGIVLARRKSGR